MAGVYGREGSGYASAPVWSWLTLTASPADARHMDGINEGQKMTDSGAKAVVWTDGSCNASGMQGRGGWAVLIVRAGMESEFCGGADDTTHNRMELTAICEALERLSGNIEIRTDSSYVEKCFNQNWRERWLREESWKGSNGPIKNRDLWERLFALEGDESRVVKFAWIKGHARLSDSTPVDRENNNRVDRLAREAALAAG